MSGDDKPDTMDKLYQQAIINDEKQEKEDDPMEGVSEKVRALVSMMSTDVEWDRHGTQFHSRSRADKEDLLPPGIYSYRRNMGGWWLDRKSSKFEFTFPVYDANTEILDRIARHWKYNKGTLGVLLNGLRGAGKTMTAQLLANKLISEMGIPVLIVREPVPLQTIFAAVNQDLMVIFDEFEKTHDDDHQQAILSTLDGLSRSSHNRLFVFTTNRVSLDENFRDRPSRIHYRFEFKRVSDAVIEGLINDLLPKDKQHFQSDIMTYLASRKVCTIDVVKAVIKEVATFNESPLEFEDLLNIEKSDPPAYQIDIIDPKDSTRVLGTFAYYFRLNRRYQSVYGALLAGNPRAVRDFMDNGERVVLVYDAWDGGYRIDLLDYTDDGYFLAELSVPRSCTPFKDFEFLPNYRLWMDNKPKDWTFPFTRSSVRKDPEAKEKLEELWEECCSSDTVYGTGEHAIFKVRIEANHEKQSYTSRYQITGDYDFD